MTGDLILGLLALLAFTRRPKSPPQQGPVQQKQPARPAPPKLRAMLYRIPADGFDTTRVAVERGPGKPMEKRAIMSSPAEAWKLVQESGWKAAPEVQQLEADPQ